MGYFVVDNLEQAEEWGENASTSYWENAYGKEKSIYFDCDALKTLSKKFEPVLFERRDFYNQPVLFPLLRLNLRVDTKEILVRRKPEDMWVALTLFKEGRKLISWFIPLDNSPGYQCHEFDLTPVISEKWFDHAEISTLRTGKMRIYLGKLICLDNKIEHNVSVAVADMLHKKIKKPLTVVQKHAKTGDLKLPVETNLDIRYGTPVLIEDDLYIVGNQPSNESPELSFVRQFTGHKLKKSYAAGTPVDLCIPAVYQELANVEAVVPLFYIHVGAPVQDTERSVTSKRLDSYIKDEQCRVSVRKSVDIVKLNVEIHIYSYNLDLASEMWEFLRSRIDNQTFIDVAGEEAEYEVQMAQQLDFDPDSTESSPHYAMNLDVYLFNNVYTRHYENFPTFKSVSLQIESVQNLKKTKEVLYGGEIPKS